MIVQKIRKINSALGKFEEWFILLLFIVMFCVIIAQAISRYVFNDPIVWTDEVACYLQMIIGYLGIAYGIRHDSHIKVDGLFLKLPRKLQILISIIFNVMFIVIAVMLIRYGWQFTMRNWDINMGTIAIGKGKALVFVPIGFAIALVYQVMNLIDLVAELFGQSIIFALGKEENV